MKRLSKRTIGVIVILLMIVATGAIFFIHEFITFQQLFRHQELVAGEQEFYEGAIKEDGTTLVARANFSFDRWEDLQDMIKV